MSLYADRRLCLTADRSEMVEETDPRAAYLAYPAGRHVSPSDVEQYGLTAKDGKVVLAGKAVQSASVKVVEAAEDKAAEPEWTLSMSPEEYIDRYGDDAKNSELARSLIEAEG